MPFPRTRRKPLSKRRQRNWLIGFFYDQTLALQSFQNARHRYVANREKLAQVFHPTTAFFLNDFSNCLDVVFRRLGRVVIPGTEMTSRGLFFLGGQRIPQRSRFDMRSIRS